MSNPAIDQFVGNNNKTNIYNIASQAIVLQRLDFRFQRERQARLRAESRLRQLQVEFDVLLKRTDQAALHGSANEYAHLLVLEAAERRAMANKSARIETERKLKAEQEATELVKSQAEADRNAWQLQEQTNVLLRKAEQKAKERLATEIMASKAASFKLQTERELAVLAEQRACAELKIAHEAELKLRAETKELALVNDRLATMQRSRCRSGLHKGPETLVLDESAIKANKNTVQMPRIEENTEVRFYY